MARKIHQERKPLSQPAAVEGSFWVRFWHKPVRAERLALMRIALAAALLGDQLIQYLPYLADYFGPNGVAPAGTHDAYQLQNWRISTFFFSTDNMQTIYLLFGLWMATTL